jgi:dolichyl-phosphate-mannose-protein mannosyltransferase
VPARRALVASVFLVSAVLRLVAVDRPINIDEALWIQRGGAFVAALAGGHLDATYTRPHPGVTTMWLVGLSDVGWCARVGDRSWESCARRLADDRLPPLSAYVVPRCVQAVITAALLALMASLSVQWLGLRPAALGCGLLAFEPFFLGYQRFITTDALATDLGAVAALWFLLYLREGHLRRLVFSGLAFGLAVATKLPAVLLAVPLLISVVVVESGGWPGFPARGLRRRARELTVWAAVGVAIAVAIWPALWVRPLGMLRQLLADLGSETQANAFRSDDSGWAFYARVLAWRFTPLMQVGALIAVAVLSWPAWRRGLSRRAELEAMAGLVLVTLVLLRLAGEAGVDRYLLPVVPFLALLAGAGWDLVRDRLAARWPSSAVAAFVPIAVVIGQGAMLVPHLPDGITFYSPLLGGSAAARDALVIGHGEGLERAAWYVDAEPGAAARVAAVPGFASAFAPHFRGRTIEVSPAAGDEWLAADRLILYVRQRQVGWPDPALVGYVASQHRPLYTVHLHGLDYARVYAGPIVVPPELREAAPRTAVR